MSDPESFSQRFLDDYFAECEEHLSHASRALLALEGSLGAPDAERRLTEELFRYYHSLKGISAMVELRAAEQLAHHLEDYLRALRAYDVKLTVAGIDTLIEGTQRLEQVIGAHRFNGVAPTFEDLLLRIAALIPARAIGGTAPAAPAIDTAASIPGGRRWRCVFAPTRDLLARGVGVDSIRKQLGALGRIVDATPEVTADGAIRFQFIVVAESDLSQSEDLRSSQVTATPIAAESPVEALSLPEPVPASVVTPSHVVRVDLTRLDDLMKGIGDLVISRARLTDTLARIERHVPAVEWRAVQENAVSLDRQLRTLRENVMRIRLVPIGEVFRRMPFVVRDLARDNGKKVNLELQGQSTEIDKYLTERLMDPVLHLVRNAVSHGIEAADVRASAGKRPEGTITLCASTVGDMVTIEISDDGAGIDVDAVTARASAAGLPMPAGTLDAAAVLALLCAPGFSTRDEADRESGRGVGMAVVKSTVEELSGTLSLATERGVGTRFTIELPLTLAITDALIGQVGPEAFAVPQQAVREVIAVHKAEVNLVEQNELIRYREGALPIVRLSRLFGIDAVDPERFHVFVVGTGASAVGLAVDRIRGQREIVVRPITDPLARVEGVSGATDLGDGRVVLILDPAALARVTRLRAPRSLGRSAEWGRLRG